ncbi:hypothetical protein [Terribacillus sp. 7520-G]|uniref:hypothetical protein n=1 Tax=Terribacillus sp. 7520-G TaxID=2025389 RepID=UPI001180984A|nr:hypothetical protein [Terribacillus sp. 7520-G]
MTQTKEKKPFRYPLAITVGIITAILFGIALQSVAIGLAMGCIWAIVFGSMPKGKQKGEK